MKKKNEIVPSNSNSFPDVLPQKNVEVGLKKAQTN